MDIEKFAINGALGLLVAILIIGILGKVLYKILDRLIGKVDETGKNQLEEMRALRSDIRDSGKQTVQALVGLTDRVSRVEGKIEGLMFSRQPEMSDEMERTPVGVEPPYPIHPYDEPESRRAQTQPGGPRGASTRYSVLSPERPKKR